jgi:hypothetical protein
VLPLRLEKRLNCFTTSVKRKLKCNNEREGKKLVKRFLKPVDHLANTESLYGGVDNWQNKSATNLNKHLENQKKNR